MKVLKDLGIKEVNGRKRRMVLVQCTKCKKEKETRADMPQKTDYCSSCDRQTHGMTNTRLYNIWSNMKARCYNENNNRYQYYGAKGIAVYADWVNDFTAFYEWAIMTGYKDELTIDRIDSNGDYTPNNCRWATSSTQSANREYPVGKAGYYGVATRYIAQIRYEHKVILNQDCTSIEEAAYVRELFIIENNLPHPRNFPEASLEEIKEVLKHIKE